MVTESIDKIDRRLIALLQSNARDATATLARRLGIARTTVHERIARMERNGTIKGYSVVLNRDPFEQYTQCHIMITIVKQKQNSIVEQLKRFPEIKLCQAVNGECDLFCAVEIPHLEDLDALLVEMCGINGVEPARSIVVMATKFDRRSKEAMGPTLHAADISRGEAG